MELPEIKKNTTSEMKRFLIGSTANYALQRKGRKKASGLKETPERFEEEHARARKGEELRTTGEQRKSKLARKMHTGIKGKTADFS